MTQGINAQKTKPILIRIMGEKLVPRFAAQGRVTVVVETNGANWTKALLVAVGNSVRFFAFEADPYDALATHHAIRMGVRLFPALFKEKNHEPFAIVEGGNLARTDSLLHHDMPRASTVS